MTELRPSTIFSLVILVAACAAGEARDADGAPVSDGAPASHDAHALHASGEAAAGAAGEATTTLAASPTSTVADALPRALVYKTPSCGCCNLWVDHMREAGFEVDARNLNDLIPVKIDAGVPPRMSSCHTALIDGYVVEGHIPGRARQAAAGGAAGRRGHRGSGHADRLPGHGRNRCAALPGALVGSPGQR